MWVFKRTDAGYTVGFYGPGDVWNAESDHRTSESAARGVNYLNGGDGDAQPHFADA